MCDFCDQFDFRSAACDIDKYGARINLACGANHFPIHEQFNYCPKCGESRDSIMARRKWPNNEKGWINSPLRRFVASQNGIVSFP